MVKAEEVPLFKGSEELKKDNTSDLAKIDNLVLDFNYTPAEIKINHKKEFETAINIYQEKYKDYIVTAETFEDDKKVRASLNNLVKTANQLVKDKLDDYNKPLEEVKEWVKSLTDPIESISKNIDDGIKLFDKQEEINRIKTIKDHFAKEVEELGVDIDMRLFDAQAESMGAKKFFMTDNKRLTKNTKDEIAKLVKEEADKQEAKSKAVSAVADAAARSGLGPAPYLKHLEDGKELTDVLEMISKDEQEAKKFQEENKKKAELEKRIQEITTIAKSQNLDPERYVQHLKDGYSALEVHTILMNDAREIAKSGQDKQKTVLYSNTNKYAGKSAKDMDSASESKTEASENPIKWQGDFRITFPDLETAKKFGADGGLYEQFGIVVEKLSDWKKL